MSELLLVTKYNHLVINNLTNLENLLKPQNKRKFTRDGSQPYFIYGSDLAKLWGGVIFSPIPRLPP